jgi:hypothetical protein
MTEHYTRNTETATAWCARCNRMTEHRVDGGRKGPCIDPNQFPLAFTRTRWMARRLARQWNRKRYIELPY